MMKDALLKRKSSSPILPVTVPADYRYRQHYRSYLEAGADCFFNRLAQIDGLMAVLGPLRQIRF
jgi:hypothetical protein